MNYKFFACVNLFCSHSLILGQNFHISKVPLYPPDSTYICLAISNSQTDEKAVIPLKFQQKTMNSFLEFKAEHDLTTMH